MISNTSYTLRAPAWLKAHVGQVLRFNYSCQEHEMELEYDPEEDEFFFQAPDSGYFQAEVCFIADPEHNTKSVAFQFVELGLPRTASQLAALVLKIDYHSAQLRLVHIGALQDREFDLARLQLIRGHLADISTAVAKAIPISLTLEPTVTIETEATVSEPEAKPDKCQSTEDGVCRFPIGHCKQCTGLGEKIISSFIPATAPEKEKK